MNIDNMKEFALGLILGFSLAIMIVHTDDVIEYIVTTICIIAFFIVMGLIYGELIYKKIKNFIKKGDKN